MTALIDAEGVVTRWPRKSAERQRVLDHLAARFEAGRFYSEAEVNEILRRHHSFGDWALLRRELFEAGRLGRDARAGRYWLVVPLHPPGGGPQPAA
ncbi:MAG: DUF2087 domain-containing protein [Mesorhizobium sp.]|jgi:hypothetical protein